MGFPTDPDADRVPPELADAAERGPLWITGTDPDGRRRGRN
jgi:hypothetical protein